MRRNFDPGTRKPFNWPESKQRIIVCWLTLQIFAASPVVNTVFMLLIHLVLNGPSGTRAPYLEPLSRNILSRRGSRSSLGRHRLKSGTKHHGNDHRLLRISKRRRIVAPLNRAADMGLW